MTVEPVDRPAAMRGLRGVVVRTVHSSFRYRVTGLAAEAAFFAILSLPPLIFGLAGAIGFVAQRFKVDQVDVLQSRVLDIASKALTPGTVDNVIAPTLDDVLHGGRVDVISIGFVLALWSGSRALNVFIDTITIMYGLGGRRGIVKTRALSFSLYIVAMVLGILLVPLVLAGPDVVNDVVPDRVAFLAGLYWPAILLFSVGFMASMYHLAVPVRKPWLNGIPGSIFTLAMWILGSYFVRWALGLSTGGTSIYGPLAAPIALLLWLYVLSISILIGAALNEAVDLHFPDRKLPKSAPPEGADPAPGA